MLCLADSGKRTVSENPIFADRVSIRSAIRYPIR
jgi:hypothetical protein